MNGEGSEFSAGEISFTMQSSDPSDALGYTDTIADLGSGTGAYGTSGSTSSDVLFGYNGLAWVQVTDSTTPYYDLAFVGMGDAPAALTDRPRQYESGPDRCGRGIHLGQPVYCFRYLHVE